MEINIPYEELKHKVENGVKTGAIKLDGWYVTFPDGHMIGGINTSDRETIVEKIVKCLYRNDFRTDLKMLD